MKINFTKKEYRLLVEMLYLSDWMMHAHEAEPSHTEHRELQEKIFSHSKEMEAEDIIGYSKELNDYYETNKLDECMQEKFINSYNDKVFWDELLERLSERDVIREMGYEKYHSLDWINKGTAIDKVKERYLAEFKENGLEHIKIEYKNLVKQPF